MVKVIHIIADLNFGGAGQYLFNTLQYHNREQYEVQVICHGKGHLYEKLKEEMDVKVHLVCDTTGPKSFSFDLLRGIYKILRREQPQIVHVHASLAGRIAGKLVGAKVILTKHWKQGASNKVLSKQVAVLLTDRIIAISKAVEKSLLQAGIPQRLIKVIHNGIDVNFYLKPIQIDFKEKFQIENPKIIGMVGRLEPEKDHKTFLKAAKILLQEEKNLTFLIVGDGSQKNILMSYTKELGIDKNVIFTGFISRIRDVIQVFDIAVLTSTNEAFGLVLAESMILGKPIVASRLDSIEEVVGDGGLFFEPGQEIELAKHLQALLQQPELGRKLGEKGKSRVLSQFNAENMVRELEKVYQEVIE